MIRESENTKKSALESQSQFDRYEAKYIIHPSLVPAIREHIQPFCIPDPNTEGDPPEYVITTLQLDSPTLALHYAKDREMSSRFKLRCRTYGSQPVNPVFLEIKRKIQGVIVKSRAMIPRECWGNPFAEGRQYTLQFRSARERLTYSEFGRLVELLGAQPVMLIRYIRESYMSRGDRYARVTFDRNMLYCPTRTWDLPPVQTRWHSMDSGEALNRPYSGVILELKMDRDAPQWMIDITRRFSLVRTGFCKYSTAVRREMIFQGAMFSDTAENCTGEMMLL
ncbi:MAG: polyphosphate polymerase domain-containing protein [Lentisphaerota bacterium]